MSDLLIVTGAPPKRLTPLLFAWAKSHSWVRSAEIRSAWEPNELYINDKNAHHFTRGKHEADLAALVLIVDQSGGAVVHVMLRDDRRIEENLINWAQTSAASTYPWPVLVAAIRELRPAVRMKWSGSDDAPPWEEWIIISSVSYLETGRVGPVPFRDVEWVEIDPRRKDGGGRLIPSNQPQSVIGALDAAHVPYTKVGDFVRIVTVYRP